MNVGYQSPETIAELNQLLDKSCQDLGRNPKDIERSLFTRVALIEQEEAPQEDNRNIMRGTSEQIATQLRQYHEAGITHFIFGVYPELGNPQTTLKILASKIMPAFR